MNREELINHINNNELLDKETLPKIKSLTEQYPYFQTAHLLLSKNLYLTDKDKFEEALPQTSALCADRRKLFYIINSKKYNPFLKGTSQIGISDRTDEILDSYLTEFATEEKEKEDTQIIESSIVSIDYLAYIDEEGKDNNNPIDIEKNSLKELKHQDIIDSFLEKAETNEIGLQPLSTDTKKTSKIDLDSSSNNSFLTETLAKIYIKQKRYEQALAIIQQISLNFPKKSAYFADQIRFLELLIFNEKNKKD